MEIRNGKMIIGAAGGTAGKGAKTYKVSIPSAWAAAMGVDGSEKEIELQFDGEQIVIKKKMSGKEFAEQKKSKQHHVKCFKYYNGHALCTVIYADFTDKTLVAENHTDFLVKTAFGQKNAPNWDDFLAFLEERCVPRQREGLQDYLEALGLDHYDPLEIVLCTEGRMAEDQQWLSVEDLS